MYIKVCGMRDAQNIRDVEALGVDLMGFIFYDKSPRNVETKPDYLPEGCHRVGVFVNSAVEDIVSRVKDFGLTFVQLHGDETPAFVLSLRKSLEAEGLATVKIVRSIAVASRSQVMKAQIWDGYVDGILFETPTAGYGGSGISFDWSLLSSYRGKTPFFLAGGIGMECLPELREFRHPRWLGIDLNSRFEISPGMKDIAKLQQFIKEIKS